MLNLKIKLNIVVIIFISALIISNSFINVFAISKKQIDSDIDISANSISSSDYGIWNLVVCNLINKNPNEFIKERLLDNNLAKFNNSSDLINKCFTVINIKSLGENPQNYNNKDYLQELVDLNINNIIDPLDNIYMLLTLSYCNYKDKTTTSFLVDNLLKYQLEGGGFSINSSNSPNTLLTGMAITALSQYKNQKNVKNSINKSIEWLSSVQLEDGSFMTNSKNSGQATMWVIMGLISNNISINDKRFVKQDKNLYEILNLYRQENGQYTDYVGNTGSGYITEQGILTLITIKNNKSPFVNDNLFLKYSILFLLIVSILILSLIFYKKMKGAK